MAHLASDVEWILTGGDQQAGKRVPQVVRSDPPHASGLQRSIPSALHAATAEYATVGTRKDQAAVASRRKAGKGLPHCRDHVYEPDRPIGLRRAKQLGFRLVGGGDVDLVRCEIRPVLTVPGHRLNFSRS